MIVKPPSPPFAPLADESVTVIVSRLVDQLCALATAAGLEPRHMVIGFTASDPADPDIHHSDVMTSGSESADMTRMLCENLMDLATDHTSPPELLPRIS